MKFHVMVSPGIHLNSIAHVKVDFILLPKMYVITWIGMDWMICLNYRIFSMWLEIWLMYGTGESPHSTSTVSSSSSRCKNESFKNWGEFAFNLVIVVLEPCWEVFCILHVTEKGINRSSHDRTDIDFNPIWCRKRS